MCFSPTDDLESFSQIFLSLTLSLSVYFLPKHMLQSAFSASCFPIIIKLGGGDGQGT